MFWLSEAPLSPSIITTTPARTQKMAGEDNSLRNSKQNLGSKNDMRNSTNMSKSKSKLDLRGSISNLISGSKHSSLRNLVGKRSSVNHNDDGPAVPKYENTYRMKPEKKFMSEPVRRLINEVLQRVLDKVKYDAEKVPELTKQIANEILAGVKAMEFDRYKIVCDVTIGEFKGQGIRLGSRCLWDTSTDSYASGSFKNATLFATAMVFGIYFE